MPNKRIFLVLLLFYQVLTYAQTGRLLIVGGGTEKNGANSWSTPAYKWAGEGRRVAIIGTSTGSLAPYFKQQCGATFAREIAVNSRSAADTQTLYDTLITYQTIFFRGGDQYDYYDYYKDTKLLDAVRYVYANGGTIGGTSAGMHILSSVLFTAKLGSAYPDECIEDPKNKYITLAEDFLDFVPGHLFDTHFAERGRFGRLTGFLGNYFLNNGKHIIGLGIDDLTCITIDEQGLGTVFGTGCANLYFPQSDFRQQDKKLIVDSIRVVQLLHGCTYHFKTGEIGMSTFNRELHPEGNVASGAYTVFASGSKSLEKNIELVYDLQYHSGQISDQILILTGELTLANGYKGKLNSFGATVVVKTVDQLAGEDAGVAEAIIQSPKIILLSNITQSFKAFMQTSNGLLLKDRLFSTGMISAFLGDDARFAGKTIVDNIYTEYAAYDGLLVFEKGLGLVDKTVIMSNTFFNSSMYENTASAVPYVMSKDTLKYGIWLTDESYFKLTTADSKVYLYGFGKAPVMVLRNKGGKSGLSSKTSSGSINVKPRMVAGFEGMTFSLVDHSIPYYMGDLTVDVKKVVMDPGGSLFPNPSDTFFSIRGGVRKFQYAIMGLDGRILDSGEANEEGVVYIGHLSPGFYLVKIPGESKGKSGVVHKLVKL